VRGAPRYWEENCCYIFHTIRLKTTNMKIISPAQTNMDQKRVCAFQSALTMPKNDFRANIFILLTIFEHLHSKIDYQSKQ